MEAIKNPANLRDLGGIRGAGGKRVAPRRLLRSGEPVGLNAAEREVLLNSYDLKCIIDLRSSVEQKNRPDDTLPGVRYVPIDIMKHAAQKSPDLDTLLTKLKNPATAESFMLEVYDMMIRDAGAQAGYREFLATLLARKEGASLFHCSAGKDRAGLAAAIILTVLGASKADIMTDYLRTNELRKEANAGLIAQMRGRGMDDGQIAAIGIALDVEAAYLEKSYSTAEELFGSFEAYVEKGLEVNEELASSLRDMYLV